MLKSVMMVCVGNICRSPFAEVYLRHHVPELNVNSSGLGALVGEPAHPVSVKLMQAKNLEFKSHCAQQITAALVSGSDLILTMEHWHIDVICRKFPHALGKVFLIGKWNNEQEILDPYKKELSVFEEEIAKIESGLDKWRKVLVD